MRRKYSFKPTGLIGVNAELPEPYLPSQVGIIRYQNANYTYNFRTFQGGAKKRHGYTNSIAATGSPILNVIRLKSKDGTKDRMLMLTPTDLLLMNTNWTSFLFRTEGLVYTTSVEEIDVATKKIVTFKAGTTLQTDGAAAGDYFILDTDWGTSDPDTDWGIIASVDSELQLTLTNAYTGTTGVFTPDETGYVRQVFSGPDSPITNTYYNWNWAVVADKLCFTNPNDAVMYYDFTTGYAIALDSTNALNFKYCIDFANRLVLANTEESGSADPLEIKWSKENDPTDWTDTTAGNLTLQTTEYEITGLGKYGNYLVVFTPRSIIFGSRTGISTAPMIFPDERKGIGAWAPDSIVHANGTVFFMSQNDFHFLDGAFPVSIGQPIRDEFFPNVSTNNLKAVKGLHNPETNEILWFMPLSQWFYAYDYIRKMWNHYSVTDTNGYPSGGGISKKSNTDNTEVLFWGHTTSALATPMLSYWDRSVFTDRTSGILCSYRTKMTDASDQDQEAFNRWKIIHRVRIHYKDNITSTALTAYLYADGSSYTLGTNTIGTGSGEFITSDWNTVKHVNFFEIRIAEAGALTKSPEIVAIEVFYELGGVYYPLS